MRMPLILEWFCPISSLFIIYFFSRAGKYTICYKTSDAGIAPGLVDSADYLAPGSRFARRVRGLVSPAVFREVSLPRLSFCLLRSYYSKSPVFFPIACFAISVLILRNRLFLTFNGKILVRISSFCVSRSFFLVN